MPVVAAALIVAWLVVRSMAVGLAATDGSGALARALAPGSAAALIDAAGPLRPGQETIPAQRTLLDRVAARAPLRHEPFLAQELAEVAAGRWAHAIRAGEAARTREPRSPMVRGVLLQAYLHQARYAEAMDELDAIVVRNGTAGDQALGLLALLAGAPRTAPLVEAALRADPPWRAAFVAYAAAHGAATPLLFRVLLHRGSGSGRADFLRSLAGAGDYEHAYLAWIGFLTPSQIAAVRPVYDGSFREPDAPAPFNWSLRDDALALAERTRDTRLPGGTALAVRFYGTQATDIASETLLLPPGRYAFAAVASGAAGGRFGGTLRWNLTCRPSGVVQPLAGPVPARATTLSGMVDLPAAGCTAQEMTLHGDPGEITTTTLAQFTDLRLDRR